MDFRRLRATHIARLLAPVAFLTIGLCAVGAPIQSPIDIRSDRTVFSSLPALVFSYSSSTSLELVNTGSPDPEQNVKINVPSGAGSLTLDGTLWPLLQFHFHERSEHTVNGLPFDMEFHMVHQLATGEYLVVGRFLEVGSFNPLLDSIFSNLPPAAGDTFDIMSFDLNGLLPSTLNSYRYTGSLTTPPFTEGVNWIVLADPIELSAGQIDQFRDLFPDGNVREIQALNDRLITTDVVGFGTVPEPGTGTIGGIGLFLLIVRPMIKRHFS